MVIGRISPRSSRGHCFYDHMVSDGDRPFCGLTTLKRLINTGGRRRKYKGFCKWCLETLEIMGLDFNQVQILKV